MIDRNIELSKAGFYPVGTDRYTFEYRGIKVDVTLTRQIIGCVWECNDYNAGCWIQIPADLPAVEMAQQLRQFIIDITPAAQLREEGYRQLDWISSSVRAALAQERAQAAGVPFLGELDSSDADDSIPACYGL